MPRGSVQGTAAPRSTGPTHFAVKGTIPAAFAIAFLFFALSLNTAEAADPVVTDLVVDAPDRITVGDPFRYFIKVEVDSGSAVLVAPAGLSEALSQTRRTEAATRDLGGGRSEVSLTLEVAAFVPGPLDLPPINLRVRAPGGVTTDVETPMSRVIVESVLPAGGVLNPRDLKPQAEIGEAPPTTLIITLIALTIALFVVLALLVWRLRRAPAPPPVIVVPEPVVSLEDRARRALDEAAQRLARGDYSGYYATVAVTVRNYLTERFAFPAFALTTAELQARMVRAGMDRWQARLVAGLLNQCDAVVFAQYRPAPERADADLTAAYEIVEMSRAEQVEVVLR